MRATIRHLTRKTRFAEVIGLIKAAMRHDQMQSWMYEALALAMEADSRDRQEIERTLMSALDFTNKADDFLYLAIYLARNGYDERALKVFRQVSEAAPLRYEAYMHGLKVAQRLNDVDGIRWATTGVLHAG